jgi:hypothetical protein
MQIMFNENVAIQIEIKPLSRNERKFLLDGDLNPGHPIIRREY